MFWLTTIADNASDTLDCTVTVAKKLKREEESSLCSIGKITGYIPPAEDRFPVRVPQANKATVRGN